MDLAAEYARRQRPLLLGGQGSGNFGHSGRPGEIGGSGSGGGEASADSGGGSAPYSEGKDLPPSNPAPVDHTVAVPVSEPLGAERPEPILAKDLGHAVELILKGEVVELQDVKTVHTVLEKLADMANDAKAKGEKAPDYDLCKVSVAGTNLFCGDSIKTEKFPNGIPRIEMPQLTGKALPGTEAAKIANEKGDVDAVLAFLRHLNDEADIAVEYDSVPAASLKATQAQLVGPTVAGMMTAKPDPVTGKTYDPGEDPIFVSSDGYVLDGHHRWAAVVGRDAADGTLGQSKMNVRVVAAPISELLKRATEWTTQFGIEPKGTAAQTKTALAMIFDGDIIVLPYREKLFKLAYRWDVEQSVP